MQFKNSVKGFVSAVEWTETWIIALGIFHFTMLLLAVTFRGVGQLAHFSSTDSLAEEQQHPDSAFLLHDGLYLPC